MKKLLLIPLLIVGCDKSSTEADPITTGWICKTDYIFEHEATPIIYNSMEECEAACPDDPQEVTTIDMPDGTGEYFTMYCMGYQTNSL